MACAIRKAHSSGVRSASLIVRPRTSTDAPEAAAAAAEGGAKHTVTAVSAAERSNARMQQRRREYPSAHSCGWCAHGTDLCKGTNYMIVMVTEPAPGDRV